MKGCRMWQRNGTPRAVHSLPREREGIHEHRNAAITRTEAKTATFTNNPRGLPKQNPWGKNTGNTSRQAALTRITVRSDRKESAGPKTPAADSESAASTHAQKQQSPKKEVRQAPGFLLPLHCIQPSNPPGDVQCKASAHWKQGPAQWLYEVNSSGIPVSPADRKEASPKLQSSKPSRDDTLTASSWQKTEKRTGGILG
ncbi:hypothetical protein NDU88_001446 [Pleurodeles waltl]|uniref:Uncharacterized protein n=1 Tax=Pleurodeles waltl TaxID=8319 RepID=A0AAV7M349_PLEWA|nr:hypothetical protein NDU88_001446 [Pleurodeles waltl]